MMRPASTAVDTGRIRPAVLASREFAAGLFDQLRRDGQPPGDEAGVWRDTYGPGEQRGHETCAAAAAAMGLTIERDAAANLYMTLPGLDASKKRIVIGSHLDSVPRGGNFDGAAGVVAGLVAIQALRRLGLTPRRGITVMGIRAEESIWFQVSYIGSRAALGTLPDGSLDARRIDTGRTLAEHIADCGGDPASDPPRATVSGAVAAARVPGTSYRTGTVFAGSRLPGRHRHRHPGQFPLPGCLDRGQ